MNIFYRIIFIVIAVCIPTVAILSGVNIVLRLPDLYVYEFNKNQIVDEIDLGITDEELGQFFSDYMKGNKEEFDLFAEYRDREQSVFGTMEQINMENARKILNCTLYYLACAALLMVLSYCILLIKKKKYELRGAFKGGILILTIALVAFNILFYVNQTRAFFYRQIFIDPFGADDILPLMLTKEFAQMSLLAVIVVAMVIITVLASATWRFTRPRRMFW